VRGVVVCPQPEAVEAGRRMLELGGNAIDAAIATSFAQGIADPIMTSIGGNGTMQVFHAESGEHRVVDFYGKAPLAARPDMWEQLVVRRLRADMWELQGRVNQVGHLAVTVPGTALALYEASRRWGRLPWRELLQPAIELAEAGFIVGRELAETMALDMGEGMSTMVEITVATAAAKRVFTNDGQPLQIGQRFQMPDYANTLRVLAAQGPDSIYAGGEIGTAIVDDFKRNGGLITEEDLRAYRLVEYEPLRGTYRGHEVCGNRPPGSGMQVIETLNILEGFDMAGIGFGTPEYGYVMSMAQRAGFVDRERYLGDPAFIDVPTEMLLSKEHAAGWRERIQRGELFDVEGLAPSDSKQTTTVSAMDGAGNAVAITHTLGSPCSGVVVDGLGFFFNNSMHIFYPYPGHPNSIAPGKSRTTGMSPTIVLRDGQPVFVTSAPGAVKILTGNLNAIVNHIDYGMTPTEAVSAPRIHSEGTWVDMEPRLAFYLTPYLEQRGVKVVQTPKSYDSILALVHAVARDPRTGAIRGGADPRARGGWAEVRD